MKSPLDNCGRRDRNNEFPATRLIGMLLFHNFAGKIPRQHENVIGFCVQQFLRGKNWQVIAGHKPPLLELIQIDNVVEQFLVDIAEGEQSGGLGRCCIAGNRLAFALQVFQQGGELVTDGMHPVSKALVVLDGRDTRVLFVREDRFQTSGGSFHRLDEQPEGSAVDLGALHVVQEKAMITEQAGKRRHREIAEMLVVNGVELALLDQVDNVRRFNHCDAGGLQQGGDAVDEAVEVGHVSEHIVGQEDVSLLALRGQLFGQLLSKEVVDAGHAALVGSAYLLFGGVDAQDLDAVVYEVAQHVTVVGRCFDDQATRVETTRMNDGFGTFGEMLQQALRHGRKVRVIAAKDNFRWNGFGDLPQRAFGAEDQVEGRRDFRRPKLVG